MIKNIFGFSAGLFGLTFLVTFIMGVSPWIALTCGLATVFSALISGFAWEAEQKELGNPV